MSAPRFVCNCFNCGEHLYERPHLLYKEDRRYQLKCPKCGQYVELNAKSWEEAFELCKVMFMGQTIYPIENLTEDDGIALGYRLPIEEPPEIICVLDTDYDESQYTHFAYLPLLRWIEKGGKLQPFKYWEGYEV